MYFSAGRAQDYRSAVQNIEAPTLILHGDDIALASSRTYERWIPNSTLVSLGHQDPDRWTGHFVVDDCLDNFAVAIQQFLKAD